MTGRTNPFSPNPELKIWIDGQLLPASEAKIGVFDHGLLYGDGIFEGIRIYGGKIFKEREHLRRFAESAKAIRLTLPLTLDEISKAMHQTMAANNLTQSDGYLRLVATRGVGSLGISPKHTACPSIIVIAATIQLYPRELYESGLKCVISNLRRPSVNSLSPRIKSLNYLNNILAKMEAYDVGAHEAILLNDEGYVTEATGDNLFAIQEGAISTPPSSAGILEGVTRSVVMKLAAENGYPVMEKNLIRHDLCVADEVFLTGTAAEIISVVSVDGRLVGDGKPGPITKKLANIFAGYRASS